VARMAQAAQFAANILMIERAGTAAKLSFKPHPHMLRHACDYALADRGHDTRALQAYTGVVYHLEAQRVADDFKRE